MVIEMNITICSIAFRFWIILAQTEQRQFVNRDWIVDRPERIFADAEFIIQKQLPNLIGKT